MTKDEDKMLRAIMVGQMPVDMTLKAVTGIPDRTTHTAVKAIEELFETSTPEKLEDVAIRILCSWFAQATMSDDVVDLMHFRLVLERIITPLVDQNEALKQMVSTLTAAKEATEDKE